MKTKKLLAALIIAASLITCFYSCEKKSETPKQECKTCIARDNVEGAPVKNEEVCSEEAEQSFRDEYSDYAVTCQ